MDFIVHNLRLKELVAIVQENRRFYEDFVAFLQVQGYDSVSGFIHEPSDERAAQTISAYLTRHSEVSLYDGLLRPYPNSKAKWFFLAWLLRDAATQRLEPLLKTVPGDTVIERKAYLLNEIRKFVEPLFPETGSWEWPAISEVMLARLEGSRRALKGTLFEELVRRNLRTLIEAHGLPLEVSEAQVRIGDETYDVQVVGAHGTLLLPVKTRETMGGGHSLLFTRDIYKSILVATQGGYRCVPIVIAESWAQRHQLRELRTESVGGFACGPSRSTRDCCQSRRSGDRGVARRPRWCRCR
jgi:hypothetical protein